MVINYIHLPFSQNQYPESKNQSKSESKVSLFKSKSVQSRSKFDFLLSALIKSNPNQNRTDPVTNSNK